MRCSDDTKACTIQALVFSAQIGRSLMASVSDAELIAAEMGLVATEGDDHRQGRADRPAFPFIQNADHFTATALHVKGLPPVLRVVEDHNVG